MQLEGNMVAEVFTAFQGGQFKACFYADGTCPWRGKTGDEGQLQE